MKRLMLAALAAATFSTAACGGDPCAKIQEKVCAEAKDGCDAWKKQVGEQLKKAGADGCKVILENETAMKGHIEAAKQLGKMEKK